MKEIMSIQKLSKFMSFLLRHSPEKINLNMDGNGWVGIRELIDNANKYKNLHLNIDVIKAVVEKDNKRRFIISDDGQRIRANQGHSLKVDLELESKRPPDILYHGTATRFLDSIMQDGLKAMSRQYVHLSKIEKTALAVGQRHGEPIILNVDAKTMYKDGFNFYLSENKVWLAEKVPIKYLIFPPA